MKESFNKANWKVKLLDFYCEYQELVFFMNQEKEGTVQAEKELRLLKKALDEIPPPNSEEQISINTEFHPYLELIYRKMAEKYQSFYVKNKQFRSTKGPSRLPKPIAFLLLQAIENSKGSLKSYQWLYDFLKVGGPLHNNLKHMEFFDKMSYPQIPVEHENTDWLRSMRESMIRNLISPDNSKIIKSYNNEDSKIVSHILKMIHDSPNLKWEPMFDYLRTKKRAKYDHFIGEEDLQRPNFTISRLK